MPRVQPVTMAVWPSSENMLAAIFIQEEATEIEKNKKVARCKWMNAVGRWECFYQFAPRLLAVTMQGHSAVPPSALVNYSGLWRAVVDF